MVRRDAGLDGSAPDNSSTALLIIDMINDLEFPGGEELLPLALSVAQRLAELKLRCRRAGMPVIYANDNFGKWQSNFHAQVDHCLEDRVRGQPIVELLVPDDQDYFVLKPKHSAFYGTTLDILLKHLQVERLWMGGIATDICVLFTANDAYMRDFQLFIPGDCVAANTQARSDTALALMQRVLKADVRQSDQLECPAATPLNTADDN